MRFNSSVWHAFIVLCPFGVGMFAYSTLLRLLNYTTAVCDDLKFPTFFQKQSVSFSRVISDGLPFPCKAEVVLSVFGRYLSLRRQHNVGLDAIVLVKRGPTVPPP